MCRISSSRAMVFPLLVTSTLVLGIQRTAIAQNPGDPVTVQFGNYLSPTAQPQAAPFLLSYACFPAVPHNSPGCDVENYVYSAAVFASFLAVNQTMQINSFTFFSASSALGAASTIPNIYDVYMGIAGGPLSLFGRFAGGNPICGTLCSIACDVAPSLACMPDGSGGVGSFLYDPSQGDLQVKMVEFQDMAIGFPVNYWYDDGAPVTRFDGVVTASPEPSTIVLAGSGFVAMLGFVRRRRRESRQ